MALTLPSKYFPVHSSTTILPFDADIVVKETIEKIRTCRPRQLRKAASSDKAWNRMCMKLLWFPQHKL